MKSFLQRFGDRVRATLSGFDRLRFRGIGRLISNVRSLGSYLYRQDLLIKEFIPHAEALSKDLVRKTEAMAHAEGYPITYVNSPNANKETLALALADERKRTSGRIAILSCVESCRTFRVRKNAQGMIEPRHEAARCQHFYHYFLHENVGLCYVRLQTWFPFAMWIGINGREWLFQQLRRERISFQRQDNLLLAVSDWPRAQALLDQQVQTDWPTLLDGFAACTNPLLPLLQEREAPYYWMTDQSEWATDIMFHGADDLARWYPCWLRHCIEVLQCRDILRFLGRSKPPQRFGPRFAGEIKADLLARHEGLRAKMWFAGNSCKVYDKGPQTMRVETTINRAQGFMVYRPKEGDETGEKSWRPMRQGVADLYRRTEVSQRANERLVESLATVAEPTPLGDVLKPLGERVERRGRRYRALNPVRGEDAELMQVIAKGEFLGKGFRNRDVRQALYGTVESRVEQRRQSAAVTRKLVLMQAHGLIHRVQKTHRYQVSAAGRRILSAWLTARNTDVNKLTSAA
jgi:hypothetical protein